MTRNGLVLGLAWLTPECRQLLTMAREVALAQGGGDLGVSHVLAAAARVCPEGLAELLGPGVCPTEEHPGPTVATPSHRPAVQPSIKLAIEELGGWGPVTPGQLLWYILCFNGDAGQLISERVPSHSLPAVRDRLLLHPFTSQEKIRLNRLRESYRKSLFEEEGGGR